MYRKTAIRLIVRDVGRRLPEMRRKVAWTNWRMALMATRAAHPDWFIQGENVEDFEPALREAGVDMASPDGAPDFVGNMRPDV